MFEVDGSAGDPVRGPRDVAVTVFEKYDAWAQGGFLAEDLVALVELVSPDQYASLLADSVVYAKGHVRQEGAIVLVSSEIISETSSAAEVLLTLDSTGIKILAQREETWRQPIVCKLPENGFLLKAGRIYAKPAVFR